MTLYFFLFITLCVAPVQLSIYPNLEANVLTFLERTIEDYDRKRVENRPKQQYDRARARDREYEIDAKTAKDKAKVITHARNVETRLNYGKNEPKHPLSPIARERYHMDPVLNFMERRSRPDLRRKSNKLTSRETSSSRELGDWKEQWKENWLQKKFEALNSSEPRGDMVNMVVARPWGVECGDPNQHDMPWGTCMLPMECDAEYRIYRGDYFCGRTSFVCCALRYTNYDMYQGFDVSFDDSSFSTDSAERDIDGINKKKHNRDKKRRQRDRLKRKRAIKRTIKKIIREMRKIFGKLYRNGTNAREKQTKLLRKYILFLKSKYRKDRKAILDIHEIEMIKVDNALQKKLGQIQQMNDNFLKNGTFRDIVVNGTINAKGARMLVEAYPDLRSYMDPRLTARRSRGGEVADDWNDPKDYLDYDIEYGLLYS